MSENRLGEHVRRRREELGLRQSDIAERMGPDIETNYVTKVETGRIKIPQQPYLGQLASALRVSEIELPRAAGMITEESPAIGIAEEPARYDPNDPRARVLEAIEGIQPEGLEQIAESAETLRAWWDRRKRSVGESNDNNSLIDNSAEFYALSPFGGRR